MFSCQSRTQMRQKFKTGSGNEDSSSSSVGQSHRKRKGREGKEGGKKKKPQPGLYRLVASATLPPTNQIRDENKDDEETEGHAHCNGHQKAQIRVQEALFSWQTERQTKKRNEKKERERETSRDGVLVGWDSSAGKHTGKTATEIRLDMELKSTGNVKIRGNHKGCLFSGY